MDLFETQMDSQPSWKQVMAPANFSPSVIVALHPLVVMNIAEHWTRVRAQTSKSSQGTRKKFSSIFKML